MEKLIFRTGIRWLWLTIIILVLDLGSKYMILYNLSLGEIMPLFPCINLHYVRNYGAAFNLLAERDSWYRWFLISTAFGVCIVLLSLMYCTQSEEKLKNISYALIIGGALGNLFDRLWHGFVIDMIDFYINNWHFAIFNFADSVIFSGVCLIILENTYNKNFLRRDNC